MNVAGTATIEASIFEGFRETIRFLVSESKFQDAYRTQLDFAKQLAPEFIHQVLLLSGRHAKYRGEIRSGLTPSEEEQLIFKHMLELTDEIFEASEIKSEFMIDASQGDAAGAMMALENLETAHVDQQQSQQHPPCIWCLPPPQLLPQLPLQNTPQPLSKVLSAQIILRAVRWLTCGANTGIAFARCGETTKPLLSRRRALLAVTTNQNSCSTPFRLI